MPSVLGTAAPTPAPNYYEFGDAKNLRKQVYDKALQAATEFEPVANPRFSISLSNVRYDGPQDYSLAEQKQAILARQSLGRQMHGTWTLKDEGTGETLATRKARLGLVPYVTDRGTVINNGTEWSPIHQLRLQPGVFTRIKDNGELEAHVNVIPGKGLSHRIYLDPETGIFRIKIGQALIPLLSLLRTMGVRDSQLREAWGNDLTAVNMEKESPKSITDLYHRVVRRGEAQDAPSQREAVAQAFANMELDPVVTAHTLGKGHSHLTPEAILDITRKLLAVSRGEAEPDDRDHLAFQHMMGPGDIFAERVSQARNTLRRALWKAAATKNLKHLPAGVFDDAIRAGLMASGLALPTEETNPSDTFDQQYRVTRMGAGGIAGIDSIPDEARAVQPSQLGFIDFLRTPESERVGVDLRLASGARRGEDGQLYMPVRDVRTGKTVYKSPRDLVDAALAFPSGLRQSADMVPALIGGHIHMISPKEVDYALPDMESTFSPLGNMIPMKSMVKGQRAVMAARMLTQALPLVNPEAPLVQSGIPGQPGHSFEERYSEKYAARRSPVAGRVMHVDRGRIVLSGPQGKETVIELYQNFPFNRKTFIHQTPSVQVGDQVQAGQVLATSNYTTPDGVVALGKNARVAYLPFRGLNFEDAIVISDSFAKRMTSEHMYQHAQEWSDEHKRGKNPFVALFPGEYSRQMLENFDDGGVIKPGTMVQRGDPLILAARRREPTTRGLLRRRKPTYINDSVTWNHMAPGVVTDVFSTDDGVNVVAKSTTAMEIGDKLSGRMGDKGVISEIVPDEQMPTDREGRPFEVLLNPLGIVSRSNPSQIVEAALGKIAARTGKPYKLADFEDIDDAVEYALKELRQHGMTDLEDVIDQVTGRKIADVFTGNRWFMKLHQTSESKAQGRGFGAYTAEGIPARGGETGSKRIGMLELNALISHGATDVIRDASLVRGQASPEYWAQFMSGFKPPTPQVPQVYEKFVHQLKASGINVVRDGTAVHIMALTDADIDRLAGLREITNAETVDWRTGLKPKRGGLFDEKLTGGHNGRRWSYIQLHEPMPNPVMEEPIRRVLGLTRKELEGVIAGKQQLNGHSGPNAVRRALERVDLQKEIARCRAEIASNKKTARDAAVRRLGYLRSTERLGIHPKDWMWSKAPVLPPAFRPVTTMGDKKLPLVADPNFLYKELFDANKMLAEMSSHLGEDVGDERLATYRALKAVAGLGDPIHPRNRERKIRGILSHVFGSSPKTGVLQQRLLGSAVDLTGRSVITPNPELDMDHVAIPEDQAWEIYRPFIVRELVRQGMSRLSAARAAKERSADARKALVAEMDRRPVIINRAPTLHRYGMMAAWPRLTKENTLQISPLVVKGFNADFDGDAMSFHVPSTDEAVHEAIEKMLPSRNLLSATDFGATYAPSQEYLGGLYTASARIDTKNHPRVFATTADAIRAYQRGEIGIDRQIEIMGL
jgi:DNA-directed RNA polymerase beta subunit